MGPEPVRSKNARRTFLFAQTFAMAQNISRADLIFGAVVPNRAAAFAFHLSGFALSYDLIEPFA